MLEIIKGELLNEEGWPKTSPLARKTVRSWMNSRDIEVLGATNRLLFDKKNWPRVTPSLELYHDIMCFRQKYYERCLRESAGGDTDWQWADEGWDLTHGIVYWIGDLLRDEKIDPPLKVEMMRWLRRMLREGHNDLLPIAVYDHLLSDRAIVGSFVFWRDDPKLSWIFEIGK